MTATECRFVDGFSAWQKLVKRGMFVAILVVRALAVFRYSQLWGWVYLVFATLGQLVLTVPNHQCRRGHPALLVSAPFWRLSPFGADPGRRSAGQASFQNPQENDPVLINALKRTEYGQESDLHQYC